MIRGCVYLSEQLTKRHLSRMIQGSNWLPNENGEANVGKAYVRCVQGDDRLRVSLKFIRPENTGVKFFNFERLKDEMLLATIQRMANNIQKEMQPKLSKKEKKGAKTESNGSTKEKSPDVLSDVGQISLIKDGQPLDPAKVTNVEAWTTASELKIGDTVYPLVQNHPTVILLQVCDTPLAEYPVPVKCCLEFAAQLDCRFEWFVSSKSKADADLVGVLHKNWNKVAEGYVYTPSTSDIGSHLLLKCTPIQRSLNGELISGEPTLSQSLQPVAAGPKECPFERRQKNYLPRYANEEERRSILRVVSYNVLAECYTDMAGTLENFFPYCPPQFLNFDYRKLLLLKEIPRYEADVLCLQEVDRHVFENDYRPCLNTFGYDGKLTLKAREVKEGLALFYKRDRFEFIEQTDHFLGGAIETDPEFAALNDRLLKVPHIRETLLTRSSVLQVVHLMDKYTGKRLLVANTHLYFHWSADNIRLLQAFVASKLLSRAKADVKTKTNQEPRVIFCGDFNSDYRCGVYRLFTKGKIPGNFNEFYQGGKQNFIPDLGDMIQTDLKLFSASGTPEYTTFVAAFAACIDYVYAEKEAFEVVNSMPMYDEDEFLPYTAVPNEVFGSDHFALVVDMKYK